LDAIAQYKLKEYVMRFIVAEDDALFGDAVRKTLVKAGYAVDWVVNGHEFFEAISCNQYDFAILDLCFPDQSGDVFLKQIRVKIPNVPVIVVSACSQVCQRVSLLQQGADDYVVKPLDLEELKARISSVLRRMPEDKYESASDVHGPLRLFSQRSCASLNGQNVTLTQREFWLLEVLVRKKNKIVSRSEIEDALYAWGDEVESNTVEVYVHRLRRKLRPDLIHTIRGVGYQLAPLLGHASPLFS
jgi:DNA-binding response OmpR family regulator